MSISQQQRKDRRSRSAPASQPATVAPAQSIVNVSSLCLAVVFFFFVCFVFIAESAATRVPCHVLSWEVGIRRKRIDTNRCATPATLHICQDSGFPTKRYCAIKALRMFADNDFNQVLFIWYSRRLILTGRRTEFSVFGYCRFGNGHKQHAALLLIKRYVGCLNADSPLIRCPVFNNWFIAILCMIHHLGMIKMCIHKSPHDTFSRECIQPETHIDVCIMFVLLKVHSHVLVRNPESTTCVNRKRRIDGYM